MRLPNMKIIMLVIMLFIAGFITFYLILLPSLISVHPVRKENGKTVDALLVGSKKYQDTFAESLNRSAVFFKPYNEAGDLIEAGRYEEALKALDESLQKSTRSMHKTMVYRARREIYQRTGNLEKELEAIEMWFAEAGEKANNPEFEQRAIEIRRLLAAKNQATETQS